MFENISGIAIKERCFEETARMIFFPKDTDRIAIVYGKNGSGKSTISEGFYQMVMDKDEIDIEAKPIDNQQNVVQLVHYSQVSRHVF